MRILISSYDFFPRIGGTETAGMTLALGLAERGYEVVVSTETEGDAPDDARFPFKIVRRPSARELLRLFRDTDVVWQNHVSLRQLWPIFLVRRPLIFTHHSPLWSDVGTGPRLGTLKRLACMMGTNVFVSDALRRAARLPGRVILNSYDQATFHEIAGVARDRHFVFLGRLVPEKGADILIDAIALLARRGRDITATIIGGGPAQPALKAQAAERGVDSRIVFTGPLRGETLARELNRHLIMVMPSRWFEGLPISAIEAFACGCIVVGADSGGLSETIGRCGVVVPKDDPAALADALDRLVTHPEEIARYRENVPAHIARFTKAALIDVCEAVIREAV
jgi:glycosyltransferase involved in cell wall biosynthesis